MLSFQKSNVREENFPLHITDSMGRQDFMQHCSCEHLSNFNFSFDSLLFSSQPSSITAPKTEFSYIQTGPQRTTSSPKRKTSLRYCIVVREHPQLIKTCSEWGKTSYLNMIILNNWVTCACGLVSSPFPLRGLPWPWFRHFWKQRTRTSFPLFTSQENRGIS